MKRRFGFLALLGAIAAPASAADWMVDTHVTDLEASYVPTEIPFYGDAGAGSCPAGSMLHWLPQGADQTARNANIQGVLAVLTTALATGKKVRIWGNNSGCAILYIHLLAN